MKGKERNEVVPDTRETTVRYTGSSEIFCESRWPPILPVPVREVSLVEQAREARQTSEALAKPLLYLDVDGVINIECLTTPIEYQEITVSFGPKFSLPVWLPIGIGQRLRKLDEHFEIVWATAWLNDANAIGKFLGLPERRVLRWNDWKLPAIVDDAGDRPWAFVDDDIALELKNWNPESGGVDGYLLPTSHRIGLTEDQTDALVWWATRTLVEQDRS